jgi:hypothetical protein
VRESVCEREIEREREREREGEGEKCVKREKKRETVKRKKLNTPVMF